MFIMPTIISKLEQLIKLSIITKKVNTIAPYLQLFLDGF